MKLIAVLLMFVSLNTFSSQFDEYAGSPCETKLVELGKSFFQDIKSEVEHVWSSVNDVEFNTHLDSFKLCDIKDLEQGSLNIRRRVEYCATAKDEFGGEYYLSIMMLTEGNNFCDGEKVISYLGTIIDY